jgi:hypothetical protein
MLSRHRPRQKTALAGLISVDDSKAMRGAVPLFTDRTMPPLPSLPSLIATDVDFERTGFQTGTLRLPWSHDRSAYGHIPIPLAVLNAGAGPTVLLTGGNHGDEYEGPVALMKLMQRLPSMKIRGA